MINPNRDEKMNPRREIFLMIDEGKMQVQRNRATNYTNYYREHYREDLLLTIKSFLPFFWAHSS